TAIRRFPSPSNTLGNRATSRFQAPASYPPNKSTYGFSSILSRYFPAATSTAAREASLAEPTCASACPIVAQGFVLLPSPARSEPLGVTYRTVRYAISGTASVLGPGTGAAPHARSGAASATTAAICPIAFISAPLS